MPARIAPERMRVRWVDLRVRPKTKIAVRMNAEGRKAKDLVR
jgi:hypothetical protein